jgi:hypothetical protein
LSRSKPISPRPTRDADAARRIALYDVRVAHRIRCWRASHGVRSRGTPAGASHVPFGREFQESCSLRPMQAPPRSCTSSAATPTLGYYVPYDGKPKPPASIGSDGTRL